MKILYTLLLTSCLSTSAFAQEAPPKPQTTTQEIQKLRETVEKIKLQREALAEQLELEKLQASKEETLNKIKFKQKILPLEQAAKEASLQANHSAALLKAAQSKASLLEAEIQTLKADQKRNNYLDKQPVYLLDPLQKDGTLVISDRRISLNGPITYQTADYVTSRINYYNNKDQKLPIFIVIDASPGGSVMSGYRILEAMKGSDAPICVVVKSFAASMAASICTLAEHSYAYPNAVILHHQISSPISGSLNLTQQKEFVKETQRWWNHLAPPVAKKMGLTPKEFIAKMYAHSTSGDWSEFGENALKLGWVNHIVSRIKETSLLQNPDITPATSPSSTPSKQSIDANGNPYLMLPRLHPKDCYFLYNPNGYYRVY